jgi:probable phosphoglycerate mutase
MTENKPAGVITAFCDGGSRGNPGPSGYGVYIQDERGETLGELSDFLGVKTNNVAEYSGLLAALNFAIEHRHPHLRVISDSELMVKQMQGKYRVNSPDLKPLYEEAKRRAALLKKFEMQHVLRGKNKEADRLANEAMDRGMGRSSGAGTDRTTGGAGERRPDAAGMRPAVSASSSAEAPARSRPAPADLPKEVTGFVKNGVVHLVEGQLPEGTFVRILPSRR